MSSLYHLKEDGTVGLCKATKRPCPLGGEHFTNKIDALKASESKLSSGQSHAGVSKLSEVDKKERSYLEFLDNASFSDNHGAPEYLFEVEERMDTDPEFKKFIEDSYREATGLEYYREPGSYPLNQIFKEDFSTSNNFTSALTFYYGEADDGFGDEYYAYQDEWDDEKITTEELEKKQLALLKKKYESDAEKDDLFGSKVIQGQKYLFSRY